MAITKEQIIKEYPERNGLSIRGKAFSVWFQRGKHKDGSPCFIIKVLEYQPRGEEAYSEGDKWFLSKAEYDTLLSKLFALKPKPVNQPRF